MQELEEYIFRFDGSSISFIDAPSDDFKSEVLASLNKMKETFPEHIKPEDNPDLLYFASNMVVLDMANGNGDCMSIATAKEVYKRFESKFIDIEHDRKHIVGNIIKCFFTKVDTNEEISIEELDSYEGLVQLSYWGYIWRVLNDKLAQFVFDASNIESNNYGKISTSFEVGAKLFDLAVGSKWLKKARIISNESEEFAEYTKYLKPKNPSGKTKDGENVYRVIKGKCSPHGVGLVANPASQVKGVFAYLGEDEDEETEEVEENDDKKQEIDSKLTENKKILINSSNDEKKCVNTVIPKIMKKVAKLEDITPDLFKDEVVASDVSKFIADSIAAKSEEYVKQIKDKDAELVAAQKAAKDAEEKLALLQTNVTEMAAKLNKIEEEKIVAAKEAIFNEGMSAFDNEYNLSDKDREILASDIKNFDSKEQLSAYFDKMKPLLQEKSKAFKKERADKLTASLKSIEKDGLKVQFEVDEKTLDFKSIVASLEPVKQAVVPDSVTSPVDETLAARMEKAFAGAISSGKKK